MLTGKRSRSSSYDRVYVRSDRSAERERDHRDQTFRDWSARDNSSERSRNVRRQRNYRERASDRISNDFQSATNSGWSEGYISQPYKDQSRPYEDRNQPYEDRSQPYKDRSQPYEDRSQPYRDRSLNHRDHHCESRRGRESYTEHDREYLNVERDRIQKEHHNQFDSDQNFSGDCGHPGRERGSSVGGDYFPRETKRFREDRASFCGKPEDRSLRPPSPKSNYQIGKAPVGHCYGFERSHTTTQDMYRRHPSLHPEGPRNMFPRQPAPNRHVGGFNSQGDRDVLLAKELVKRTCCSGGELTLDNGEWQQFCREVIGSVPFGDMDSFFHRFPHIFSCEPDPTYRPRRILRVKTTLELCKDHCSKGGCRRLICEGLHCCKFFLFDTCKFKGNCNFGHNLTDPHNHLLLAKHHLDVLTPPEIGVLLKAGKASQVFPKVCKFYNVEGGCRNGDKGEKCRAMHVCRHYVLNDCNFGKHCKRSHNIYDAQPKNILKKHGIRIDRSPKQVLEELRAAMKQDGCAEGDDLSDGEIRSSGIIVSRIRYHCQSYHVSLSVV